MTGGADDAEITSSDTAAVRSLADLARLLRRLRRREARRRGAAPLTYRDLAARTGWSHSTVGVYLSGQALAPTDRFDVLLQLLGASPDELGVLATARDRVEEDSEVDRGTEPDRAALPSAAVPHTLPTSVPHFTCRHAELKALTDLVPASSAAGGAVVIAAIGGTAGVGKTALALHWAHRVAHRFPDGQLYVNLRGFGPTEQVMDPAEAVHGFLDAMQVPPQRIPGSLDGRTALYRTLLAGKRMLIVLDNARDTGQVRPLLPGTPGCLVLVTSRNLLSGLIATDGAQPISLDLLTEDEAWELLARRLGHDRLSTEPDAVKEIITYCARLPLALAVVAAGIAARPGAGLAGYAAELRDTRRRWAALTGDDPATDVRAVFWWSYQTVSPAAARLFRLLGLHPGPDLTAPAAASLCGVPVAEVRPLLAELTRAHLVAEQPYGRFTQHDLLRAYAVEQLRADPVEQREAATRRMIDHYLYSACAAGPLIESGRDPVPLPAAAPGVEAEVPVDREDAVNWLNTEHRVLLAMVDQSAAAGLDAQTWRLAWALAPHLDTRGHWHEWFAVAQLGLSAAQRLDEPVAQAQAHRFLASAASHLNHLDLARIHLLRAFELAGHSADPTSQAHTQLLLSNLAARQGRNAEALDHAERALDRYRAASHQAGQADALNSIGWYHAQLGNYARAITYCEQGLALCADDIVAATTWDSLGYAHQHLGEHERAITCYRRAVELFGNLDARHDRAESLTRLADAQEAAGDPGAARESRLRALAIVDELDHPLADRLRAQLGPAGGSRPG
jgi:tetratricopeptide (TPR) repeat protein